MPQDGEFAPPQVDPAGNPYYDNRESVLRTLSGLQQALAAIFPSEQVAVSIDHIAKQFVISIRKSFHGVYYNRHVRWEPPDPSEDAREALKPLVDAVRREKMKIDAEIRMGDDMLKKKDLLGINAKDLSREQYEKYLYGQQDIGSGDHPRKIDLYGQKLFEAKMEFKQRNIEKEKEVNERLQNLAKELFQRSTKGNAGPKMMEKWGTEIEEIRKMVNNG
jgi:hypothetical protein